MKKILSLIVSLVVMVTIVVPVNGQSDALTKAQNLKKLIKDKFQDNKNIIVMGPAPSLIANFKGMYRFNLLLKTNDLDTLRNYLRECKVDIDKNITVDINPINTN